MCVYWFGGCINMASSHKLKKGIEHMPYLLRNGDCMLRTEFHSLYEQMPEGYRAELLGGTVFEPSPVSWGHGEHHLSLGHLLKTYSIHTPRVLCASEASVILSEEDEVQPDLVLRIDQAAGGNSFLTDRNYVEGAPELVAEIAYSSRAIDLHLKRNRYRLAGIAEYMVVCLEPNRLYWFDLTSNRELPMYKNMIRSVIFPGLWIDVGALLELNNHLLIKTLTKGLKSKEHREFVAKLS